MRSEIPNACTVRMYIPKTKTEHHPGQFPGRGGAPPPNRESDIEHL